MSEDKLITIEEASNLLSVSKETLRRWDRAKILSAVKINKRGDRRFKKSEILKMMELK